MNARDLTTREKYYLLYTRLVSYSFKSNIFIHSKMILSSQNDLDTK